SAASCRTPYRTPGRDETIAGARTAAGRPGFARAGVPRPSAHLVVALDRLVGRPGDPDRVADGLGHDFLFLADGHLPRGDVGGVDRRRGPDDDALARVQVQGNLA